MREALQWFINDIDGTHTVMRDFDANVARAREALAKDLGSGFALGGLSSAPADALLAPLRDLLAAAVRQWPEEWVLERDGAYANILRKGTPYAIASDMGRHQAALMVALRNAAPVLLAASPSPWRDMESAPKDGKAIIVYLSDEGFSTLARWREHEDGPGWYLPALDEWAGGVNEDFIHSATNWQPLPSPPSEGEK